MEKFNKNVYASIAIQTSINVSSITRYLCFKSWVADKSKSRTTVKVVVNSQGIIIPSLCLRWLMLVHTTVDSVELDLNKRRYFWHFAFVPITFLSLSLTSLSWAFRYYKYLFRFPHQISFCLERKVVFSNGIKNQGFYYLSKNKEINYLFDLQKENSAVHVLPYTNVLIFRF